MTRPACGLLAGAPALTKRSHRAATTGHEPSIASDGFRVGNSTPLER
jgi:hypothetical protein